jgi:hypothetical protein
MTDETLQNPGSAALSANNWNQSTKLELFAQCEYAAAVLWDKNSFIAVAQLLFTNSTLSLVINSWRLTP